MEETSGGGLLGKPWLQDTVYVVESGPVFRAQPPTKVVNTGQIVTWKTKKGHVLFMQDQYGLTNVIVDPSGLIVTAQVTGLPGDMFEYTMTCDGTRVEGNSPPMVIIE